jgi:hypothetical protein
MSCADFVRKLDIRKQVRILRKEDESFLVISEQRETPQLFQTAVFCGTGDRIRIDGQFNES